MNMGGCDWLILSRQSSAWIVRGILRYLPGLWFMVDFLNDLLNIWRELLVDLLQAFSINQF
jgi:hypothetical protein